MKIDEVTTDVSNRPAVYSHSAARVLSRCDQLAQCSETKTGLTRTFLSPAMNEAHELVSEWMSEAGLTTRVDALGNLIGHYPASETVTGNAIWLFGSHLDTVPNAGKYDGMLGVLLAIEVVSLLRGQKLPFTIEVIGFSEEEGVRFKAPYLGSRAIAGTFDPEFLELRDHTGTSVRQAIRRFGLTPEDWPRARYQSSSVLGYFEAHIEQGPVLELAGAPLGVVTDIVGQSRLRVRFVGQSGHAGTQPMNHRRDALAAAGEWIWGVETVGNATSGLVATVGSLEVSPNTPNVVAGEAVCSLDVRHASDATRENAVEELLGMARKIAQRRGVELEIVAVANQKAVPMDAQLRAHLQTACKRAGVAAPEMESGAGHDAAIMATLCPCTMLFLRTPGGASHCPEENVTPEDVALALEVMGGFLQGVTQERGERLESPTF